MLQNQEFIQDFVEEALAHISSVEEGLLKMDGAAEDSENINIIFRAVHSIKGTAGFFGLKKIVEISHAMENIFGEIRSNKLNLEHDMVDYLLTANDFLRSMVENIHSSESMDISDIVKRLSLIYRNADLSEGIRDYDVAADMKAAAVINEEIKEAPARKSKGTNVDDSIRVNVPLMNNLLNLSSEMVLGRNQLLCALDGYRKDIPGIDPILQNIDRITTELQEKIMQTRMQPIANVFNKFPRMIRDLSKKMGKEIGLHLEGEDVELDKSIIEALGDPLTHLVRNAAGHGIEMPDKREVLGKPRTGNIVLKAYHEGGHVSIDVADDGAGIDVERVKKKALESELVHHGELSEMSEQEILRLILRPGFSTAEKVTDISGRGVGMDVVKTNIEKLGGTIETYSRPGSGTTMRLILPLTLAIIPSLIVEVRGQKFALPQVNLQEIVRIKPGDATKKIEYLHHSEVLRLRGKLLPIVHLSDVLGFEGSSGTSEQKNILRILVLKVGSKRFGLVVDTIHDGEEILVKPLPKYFMDCRGYSGVTIMGDGKTAMILDLEGIVDKANLRFAEEDDLERDKDLGEKGEAVSEQQNLLLFKCSGQKTFAIDLSMVSRVEEISTNNIERIGEREHIKFRGDSLRVIRPEKYLPVSSNINPCSKLFVIIPKLVNRPMGIIIEKIYDTVQTGIKLNEEDIKAKGLAGSAILNNQIVLLIKIYELFEMADPEFYTLYSKSS